MQQNYSKRENITDTNRETAPIGIKIISGLTIVMALSIGLFGFGAILGYFIEGSFLSSFYGFDEFPDANFGYVLLFASALIGFGSLIFYAGYGLLKGNNIARRILVTLLGMELFGSIQGLMIENIRGFALLFIVILGPILFYIIFSEEVKRYFNYNYEYENLFLKSMFRNLKKVLKNIPSLLVGLILGGLLYWVFVSTTKFTLIEGNLGSIYVKLMILVYFLVSLFIGLLAATTLYKIIFSYKMNKRSGLGTVAAFFALLGAGCPACSITLAGYIGLNFILMSLPLYGLEIQVIGLFVLVYAVYYNLKNLEACKFNFKKKK